MFKGLMLCFVVLFVQLGILRYVDLRVASMALLDDAPVSDGDASLPDLLADSPANKLDA